MINHTKARYKTWLHRPYHDTPYFITTFLVYHREADGEASADEPCPMCRRPGIMACLGTLKQLLAAIILTTNDTEWRYVLGNILHCLRGWKLFIQYTNLLQCNIGKSEQPVLLPEEKKKNPLKSACVCDLQEMSYVYRSSLPFVSSSTLRETSTLLPLSFHFCWSHERMEGKLLCIHLSKVYSDRFLTSALFLIRV